MVPVLILRRCEVRNYSFYYANGACAAAVLLMVGRSPERSTSAFLSSAADSTAPDALFPVEPVAAARAANAVEGRAQTPVHRRRHRPPEPSQLQP